MLDLGDQEVKGQSQRGPKSDLEAWQKHHADADEFIKLVARGLNRYNIIKRETCIQLKNITIRLTEKEHN